VLPDPEPVRAQESKLRHFAGEQYDYLYSCVAESRVQSKIGRQNLRLSDVELTHTGKQGAAIKIEDFSCTVSFKHPPLLSEAAMCL
jgi:hypothetical protein